MIQATLGAHPHKPELHSASNELAPRVDRVERNRQISGRIAGTIKEDLTRYRQEIAPDLDLADAATIIEAILEAVGGKGTRKQHRAIIFEVIAHQGAGT